jgi:CRISPR-associated protein Csb2
MSLTIAVQFLTGYCVAALDKVRPDPEWPPHPSRLFMALAAAHFEVGDDPAGERAALGWLESLAPPHLAYDTDAATACPAVPTFVPTNDLASVGRGGVIQSLPALKRHRAARLFPRTHLADGHDVVRFTWPTTAATDMSRHRPALERLCGQVGRLGHSTSLVQVWVDDDWAGPATLVPDDVRPTDRLRVMAGVTGTLDRLARAFATPPYRPTLPAAVTYGPPRSVGGTVPGSLFDPQLEAFRLTATAETTYRSLDVISTLALTKAVVGAIVRRVGNGRPVVESISGHRADGSATDRPHVAVVPLPFVGGNHGDGHLMGFAVAVPVGMDAGEQRLLMASLDDLERLALGPLGSWGVSSDVGDRPSLQATTWTGGAAGAAVWATVTPVAYDSHPKGRGPTAVAAGAARLVAEMCLRVGLPVPADVQVGPVSPFKGVPSAGSFPRLMRKDGSPRRQTHAIIEFDRPVIGPVLIGAGRYRGYGLLRPWREGGGRE